MIRSSISSRPIGIDLFSGAGGMSLGFEQAGIDVVAAVEIDPIHALIHQYNFPHCAVLPKSVVGLTGEKIRATAGIGNSSVDVVFGGAPCQGFSMIGQRLLDDPRNSLVAEFVRIVSELNASSFVFENVKGLTVGKHRKFLDELISAFNNAGYNVQKEWQVLNAANYGVPQNRQRLFLLGVKKGKPLPSYPDILNIAAGSNSELILPSGPSCKDALGDIPDCENFSTLIHTDEVETKALDPPSNYAKEMRCYNSKHWHYGYKRKWTSQMLTSSIRTNHSDISRNRFAETPHGCIEPISRFFKLSPSGVCNTLRAGTDASRGAFTSPRPIHYEHSRCITVREMARLHGFPDWFRLHRTKWHGARQIGNAVPPPLARAVASQMLKALEITPKHTRRTLKLGDDVVLGMDMKQASNYWNVEMPNGKRDRKSGAKKRTQAQTEAARLALLK
ncbi:MAG: DNA cytosine methyltransferase [Verrucomicrobiales bacterium]|nr:DNA cytosine methyltransferase [Verrucomicrobiales bacterium]